MVGARSFAYRAIRRDGAVESGALRAADPDAVRRMLAAQGLLTLTVGPAEGGGTPAGWMGWGALAQGLRVLANLLRAGLPLDRALDILGHTAPVPWTGILPAVQDSVRQGRSLGRALTDACPVLPAAIPAMLDAGWDGLGAHRAVDRAAGAAETAAATRAAIRRALAYPLVLLTTGTASIGFLLVVILPRFAAILADLGHQPPPLTRLALQAGALLSAGWRPLLVAVVIGLAVAAAGTATERGRFRWHAMVRRLPVIGPIRVTLGSARATGIVGALLESGVRVPAAFGHGAAASSDQVVSTGLLSAREAVAGGASPSGALSQSMALTPVALRLLRAGEESGQLGVMCSEASRVDQEDAERLIRRATGLVEPVFILAFGGLVALVATALLQALYGVRP